jgi:chromosome segregation ATPase
MDVRKGLGYLFVFTAALGLIMGLFMLVSVWRYRPILLELISGNIQILDQSLTTTQDGLEIISQEVQLISTNMTSLLDTTQALGDTIHASGPMLDSLNNLTSKDLPNTITATQSALLSAQSSAQLMDNVLSTLTSIPFINVAPYQPQVPLHTALSDVSTSLNSLRPALVSINASLTLSKNNMSALEKEMTKISETTKDMSSTFSGVQAIVNQYKVTTQTLQNQIQAIRSAAPGWINSLAYLFTLGLLWFMLAQASLLAQGLYLLGKLSPKRNYPVV